MCAAIVRPAGPQNGYLAQLGLPHLRPSPALLRSSCDRAGDALAIATAKIRLLSCNSQNIVA